MLICSGQQPNKMSALGKGTDTQMWNCIESKSFKPADYKYFDIFYRVLDDNQTRWISKTKYFKL